MARFDRLTVLNTMLDTGLVPIFYNGDLAVSKEVVLACARGGTRLVEFTNRGDRAWNVFTDLIDDLGQADPTVILGVGTMLDAPTAALYIASGANFIVGPNFNPEVARLCNRRKVAYIPGCGTVSEISAAEEMGVGDRQDLPGREARRAGLRQGGAGADALDAHYADRRRGRHPGERSGLDQGRRGLPGHRQQPDPQRLGHRRQLRRHRGRRAPRAELDSRGEGA